MIITIPDSTHENITSRAKYIFPVDRQQVCELEAAELLLWMYSNLWAETFESFRSLMNMTSDEMDAALDLARNIRRSNREVE